MSYASMSVFVPDMASSTAFISYHCTRHDYHHHSLCASSSRAFKLLVDPWEILFFAPPSQPPIFNILVLTNWSPRGTTKEGHDTRIRRKQSILGGRYTRLNKADEVPDSATDYCTICAVLTRDALCPPKLRGVLHVRHSRAGATWVGPCGSGRSIRSPGSE